MKKIKTLTKTTSSINPENSQPILANKLSKISKLNFQGIKNQIK